jgi:hypothetical protein
MQPWMGRPDSRVVGQVLLWIPANNGLVALAGSAAAVPFVVSIGAVALVLLLLGIRNAWDLAMTLAQYAHERHTNN